MTETKKSEESIKLEKLGHNILNQLKELQNPQINIPLRSLSNTYFDEKDQVLKIGEKTQERTYLNLANTKKFMQTLLIASACKDLIKSGKTTSIRDLFYMTKHTIGKSHENTFEDQSESDPIIEDLEVTIDSLRENLHLFASTRGAMVGNATIVDSGDTINLATMGSGGWGVPSIVEEDTIQFKKIDANFILVVEKDAMWRRLNEDKFWKKHNCILMHGQGMAPRGVRRLLWRLNKELKIPVYVFVDNDPWGFYIYSVYKQGSINLAYENKRMAVPEAKFLGLSSYDQDKFNIPSNANIKLTKTDVSRCKEILNYSWFQKKSWQKEIKHMMDRGVKLELEALSKKGLEFTGETYLPEKIKNKDWLD